MNETSKLYRVVYIAQYLGQQPVWAAYTFGSNGPVTSEDLEMWEKVLHRMSQTRGKVLIVSWQEVTHDSTVD